VFCLLLFIFKKITLTLSKFAFLYIIQRIFKNSQGAPATGSRHRLVDLAKPSHPLHHLLKCFDLGLGADELHKGFIPVVDPINKSKFNVDGQHIIPSFAEGLEPVSGWPGTMFRFPLRTARMEAFSQICAKCGAVEHTVEKVESKIYEEYTKDSAALNRLLFLRCVQSVKLLIWEEGQSKPSPYFSIEIENIKQFAEQRRSIISWLKTGMKEIEKEEEKEEKASGMASKDDDTFYKFFRKVRVRGPCLCEKDHEMILYPPTPPSTEYICIK
jgi:hypothetical protein